MNDDELDLRRRETQLHDELHRRVVPPDAPDRLYGHVARLGMDQSDASIGATRAFGSVARTRHLHRAAGVLTGLAAVACVVTIVAAGLAWRSSHSAGPAAGASASGESASPPATSSAGQSVQPSSTLRPTSNATWAGKPVSVAYSSRLDAQFGWVVGGPAGDGSVASNLYVTADGGATWQVRTPPQLAGSTWPLQFSDRDHAAYTAAHQLYLTADGGATWTATTIPGSASEEVNGVDILDGRHIWIRLIDAGRVLQLWATTDGAATWSLKSTAQSLYTAPYFTFVSPQEGWGLVAEPGTNGQLAGNRDKIAHTLDGGRSWTTAGLGLSQNYEDVGGMAMPPIESGGRLVLTLQARTVAPHNVSFWLLIVASSDGGATWTLDSTFSLGHGEAVMRVGSLGLFYAMDVGGMPSLYKIADLETSAFVATVDPSSVCRPPVADKVSGSSNADFATAGDVWVACGYAAGDADLAGHVYLFGTTDGGKTWRPLLGQP